MTEREALKLALEALEAHADIGIKSDKAIAAIKQALAQPEQEPAYPWFMKWNKCADFWAHYMCMNEGTQEELAYEAKRWIERMRQAAELNPAVKEPVLNQTPVAWRAWVPKFPPNTGNDWAYVTQPMMNPLIHNQPLYTSPKPIKPWVEITPEELMEASNHYAVPKSFAAGAAWANAKLKEKNT